ncbi:SMI1/KNR4 family protein [Shewanella algae]|uniref:SMI1/KNR4 family protein n=1 Tax=Shewanella algae TaxID=38313 RepID=UPI001AAE5C24|nr:SMI1/KNR4 family protein [Shewanella algae]MBO2588853.1 SMI1/KNR4 family protein [Shewanella algae]
MNIEQFSKIFNDVKSTKPLWLEGEMEPKASDEAIFDTEKKLGVKLPEQLIEFIKNIGSGYFGYTNVFSVNPSSEWYLIDVMEQFSFPDNFIPISDDETGGYYGFLTMNNICNDEVYYWHSSEECAPQIKYKNFYEYIVKVALGQ